MTTMITEPIIDLQWPDGRNAGILHLCDTARKDDPHYCRDDTMRDNKLWILNLAYQAFHEAHQSDARLFHLTDPARFKYASKQFPDNLPGYVQHDPPPKPTTQVSRRVAPWPYTFESGPGTFWVDFADTFLGGGTFGNGFLQEEVMCHEIPELGDAAGLRWLEQGQRTLFTRYHGTDPAPLALVEALRTVRIPERLKRNNEICARKIDPGETDDYRIATPSRVNILAMATAKLDNVTEQGDLDTACDLFNTFAAGFTLVRERAGAGGGSAPRIRVNTGPIGTGNFKQNRHLVYVMQVLAARFVGIDELVFFGYSSEEEQQAEIVLHALDAGYDKERPQTVLGLLRCIPAVNIPH